MRRGRHSFMAVVEGRGKIIPHSIAIKFSEEEINLIINIAKDIAIKKRYDFDNTLLGWAGESALAKYIYQQLGISHLCNGNGLERGDGSIDMTIADIAIQVKTHSPDLPCRIKRIVDGRLVTQKASIFVFCEGKKQSLKQDRIIKLLGWIQNPEKIGRFQNPYLVIDSKDLQPIPRLVKYLSAKAQLQKMRG